MCEQCSADTVMYLGPNLEPVLPGYFLCKATRNGNGMRAGDWGLGRSNDPDYWWSAEPVEDPDWHLSDEEIDRLYATLSPEGGIERSAKYDAAVDDIDLALDGRTETMLDPKTAKWMLPCFENAAYLYKAGEAAGYDPEVHGHSFSHWLCHHIGVFLKTARPYTNDELMNLDLPDSEAIQSK